MLQYCIICVILGWKVLFHPFYLSLSEIRYIHSSQSLEISQRIFWDDFEIALTDLHQTKIDFLNPQDEVALDSMVKEYFLENYHIVINGKKTTLNYLGFEIEDDAAWFYLEAKGVPVPETASVKSSVLLAHFETQQNIINFYVDKNPKSLILYKNKDSGTLTF